MIVLHYNYEINYLITNSITRSLFLQNFVSMFITPMLSSGNQKQGKNKLLYTVYVCMT